MNDDEFLRGVLQRIATGPTMSKDLPREDARRAMRLVLQETADPVQAGIFLIALRMKRETDEEMAGILEAIGEGLTVQSVAVDRLMTIVEPYDGYLRGTPVAAFLPAVLASLGVRVLTHGVTSMGPKFGASQNAVLAAAGYPDVDSLGTAARLIEDESIGWCHVDQCILAPELAALTSLRSRIVKRPCLTTIEVAVNALRPREHAHLVTGFVHKGYPPIYAGLAAEGRYQQCTLVRGVEGGVIPSLSQASRYFTAEALATLTQHDIEAADLGIDREERAVPLPKLLGDEEKAPRSVKSPGNEFAAVLAEHAATIGLAALDGQAGYARDSLIYAGAVLLTADGRFDTLAGASVAVAETIDSGAVRRHFDNACAKTR